MQTIATKFLPPTTHKGERIRATHTGGAESVLIDGVNKFDSTDEAHKHAAALLMRKLGWDRDGADSSRMIGGHTNEGMVWVFELGAPEISSWTFRKIELEGVK